MKINTPYQGTRNSTVCMYCGEVFTSRMIYSDGHNYTVSARRQLEAHYMAVHKHD